MTHELNTPVDNTTWCQKKPTKQRTFFRKGSLMKTIAALPVMMMLSYSSLTVAEVNTTGLAVTDKDVTVGILHSLTGTMAISETGAQEAEQVVHYGLVVEAHAEPPDLSVRLGLRADASAVEREHRGVVVAPVDPGRGGVDDRVEHHAQSVPVGGVHEPVDVVPGEVVGFGVIPAPLDPELDHVQPVGGHLREVTVPVLLRR